MKSVHVEMAHTGLSPVTTHWAERPSSGRLMATFRIWLSALAAPEVSVGATETCHKIVPRGAMIMTLKAMLTANSEG